MKPTTILISLFFTLLCCGSVAHEGIGGSGGGPGAKTWDIEIPRGTTIDWPMVRVHMGRNLTINHFCIQDDETLRTLKKYGPKFSLNFYSRTLLRWDRLQQRHQFADRYFDDSGCYGSRDPKCAEVNGYIDETIRVPIYRGEPRSLRGGKEDIRDFARRALLLDEVEVTIPKCN